MSFEEEFDSIIRRKSEELDFPFDEKNWDKASILLDAESPVAAPAFKRFMAPALIATAIIISGIVVWVSMPSPAASAKEQEPVAQASMVSPANTSAAAEQEHTAGTANASTAPQTETSANNSSTNNTTANTTVANNTHNTLATLKNNSPVANTSGATLKTAVAVGHLTTTNNEQPATVASNNKNTTTNAMQATTPDAVAKSTTDKNAARPTSNSTTNAAPANQTTPAANNVNTLPVSAAQQQQQQNTANTAAQGDATPALTTQQQPAEVTEPVEQLPVWRVGKPQSTEPEVAETSLNYLNRYDDDYFKNNKKHKTHFLNAELGGTYLLGWNTQAGKDGKGLDWFGGFNYGVYLSNKISISAGLQVYDIKNITQAFYTSKKVDYDFGATTSNTIITSNNLYYAAIPLKVAYALNKTSQFAVGANFGYLIDSKNTVDTYQVRSEDNVKMHNTSVKNTGVYRNTSSVNLMLSASYKVEVMHRLALNTELVYGLTDLFKNTKTIKNNEQAVGIRLSLQYTLFDK